MSKYVNIAIFGLLMSLSSLASADSGSFPADLMYSDNPIDALCFSNLENDTSVINLQNCGIAKQNYSMTGQNNKLIQKGFIGFDWQDKANQARGFSYFKIFPAGAHQYWLYSINNGGGSGVFSSIDIVKRKNPNTLSIDGYANGDRCNGGIQDVAEHNHQLTFSINLTPYDFISLTKDNPHNIKAYQDLASCATCCVARAFYEVDPGYDPELQYVSLAKRGYNVQMPDQGLHQECFNKLVATYISNGQIKLDDITLKKFVNEFNQTCIKE